MEDSKGIMNEPPICARCEDEYSLEFGLEPTKYCHECAHKLVAELEKENDQWKTWGIVEIAVRNPNVASYIVHWEARAFKAEEMGITMSSQIGRYQVEIERLKNDLEKTEALLHIANEERTKLRGNIAMAEYALGLKQKIKEKNV